MRDDALQFVARQQFHRAERDADGHVFARVAGGKRVDAALAIEHINFRHGISEATAISSTTSRNRFSSRSDGLDSAAAAQ